jgi:DNA-binding GntR family transcriptional regulator
MEKLDANSQDKAYRFVKEAILDLEFKPNEPLRAQSLAETLKVSRTPVREALGRLEQEGLVIRDRGWGYIVKPVTLKEAMDVYKVRESLEVQAVREVMPNINKAFLLELRNHLKRAGEQAKQGRLNEYRKHTREFYKAIAKTTDNNWLCFMISLIDDRIRLLGAIMADRHLERPKESLIENHAVLSAIEASDADAAEIAVRNHISSAKETLSKYVLVEAATVTLA